MTSRITNCIKGGILDVETTGFSPVQDEVIELCIVLFNYDAASGEVWIEEEYVGLREPACGIRAGAARVNGITSADVYGKDLDYERVADLIHRAEFLIAHNASFDRSFVAPLFPIARAKTWYCSMAGIDWRGKGYPNRKLQDLLQWHGIYPGQAHRASDDVRATLQLLSHRQNSGAPYLAELLDGRKQIHKGIG